MQGTCVMLYLYIADEKGIAFCSIGSTIKSFTEVFNQSRQCFYFASMICCPNYMQVLQGNGGINPEANKTLFLLSDDKLLLLIDVPPLRKLMDTSRT